LPYIISLKKKKVLSHALTKAVIMLSIIKSTIVSIKKRIIMKLIIKFYWNKIYINLNLQTNKQKTKKKKKKKKKKKI